MTMQSNGRAGHGALEARVVATLQRAGQLEISVLAERTQSDIRNVGEVLRRLKKQGLVRIAVYPARGKPSEWAWVKGAEYVERTHGERSWQDRRAAQRAVWKAASTKQETE